MTSKPFTTCLWFEDQGEEAARYYAGIFKNSSVGRISRYTSAGGGPEGSVATVEFELNGQRFLALNGGAQDFGFNEAVSLVVQCADQAEVDYYWERLTEGGEELPCGWLKDKYGLRWQITPTALLDTINDPDREKAARAYTAMFTMKKIDIAAIQRAAAGAR